MGKCKFEENSGDASDVPKVIKIKKKGPHLHSKQRGKSAHMV
jgi:hypothetical protein